MTVDYNNFAKSFAASRKNMKWAELEYFFSLFETSQSILDIGCGSGRLLEQYHLYFGKSPKKYTGIDLSDGLLSEAKLSYPNSEFICGNMLEISRLIPCPSYDVICMIASFHHLGSYSHREKLLFDLHAILPAGGKIFMTNWALNSPLNQEKYSSSLIANSENTYGGCDYNIKIGHDTRFYHCFSLEEISQLSTSTGFHILENRLFDGERNYITILQK